MSRRDENRKKLDGILRGKGLEPIERTFRPGGETTVLFGLESTASEVRRRLIAARVAVEQRGARLTVWLDAESEPLPPSVQEKVRTPSGGL